MKLQAVFCAGRIPVVSDTSHVLTCARTHSEYYVFLTLLTHFLLCQSPFSQVKSPRSWKRSQKLPKSSPRRLFTMDDFIMPQHHSLLRSSLRQRERQSINVHRDSCHPLASLGLWYGQYHRQYSLRYQAWEGKVLSLMNYSEVAVTYLARPFPPHFTQEHHR